MLMTLFEMHFVNYVEIKHKNLETMLTMIRILNISIVTIRFRNEAKNERCAFGHTTPRPHYAKNLTISAHLKG